MARVTGVAFLFILTIIQRVNAIANPCKDKAVFDGCGDGRLCLCADENIYHVLNEGEFPCNNLVCRDARCHFFTGVPGQPKRVEGAIVLCSTDAECGNNFMCVNWGYCCRRPKFD
ncbi:uncharacterized protein LOC132747332 [Ruditapes philippinarum]|uniref:uncharacterized protein LOC132747332 n=1 Tax=Ruditapes philippinarum TaxID=129788 RepID=UPI00295AD759|nr:uncharacterized protein LOC132747332 [Ruditapes philippinarum]